jgi:hypothetical protein
MAAPIRPLPPGQTPGVSPAPTRSPEALAAQRAFFASALGKAGAPAAATPQAPVARPRTVAEAAAPIAAAKTQAPAQLPAPGDAPPARILRPGSLIDIKV